MRSSRYLPLHIFPLLRSFTITLTRVPSCTHRMNKRQLKGKKIQRVAKQKEKTSRAYLEDYHWLNKHGCQVQQRR